jgi:hypothetical protein
VVLIIQHLTSQCKDDFVSTMTLQKNWFSKNVAELVSELFDSWSIFILTEAPEYQSMFELGMLCLSHQDRALSYFTLEFWEHLKNDYKSNLAQSTENLNFIFKQAYCEIFKRLFTQSRIKDDNEIRILEKPRDGSKRCIDVDEEEDVFLEVDRDKFPSIDLAGYRIAAEDVFYSVYHVYTLQCGPDGTNLFMDLISDFINQNKLIADNPGMTHGNLQQLYLLNVECSLYTLRAVKDFVYRDNAKNPFIGNI